MVIVPLRALPVFGAALNVTLPSPLPLAPAVTEIHGALLLAVHEHPLPADTLTVPLPPPAAIAASGGAIVYVQGGAAAWFTVNVCPAIVMVALRALPVFRAALNVTLPSPLPVAPAVTEIHGALLFAVQAQPLPADTVTVPVPPPAAIAASGGAMVYVQGAGAAA
jgi:hypothetical protein